MKPLLNLVCFSLLFACSSKELRSEKECEQLAYSQPEHNFKVVSRMAFDTTANLFHATILDDNTSEPLSGSKLHFTQGQLSKEITTDQTGKSQVFENGFSGIWQLRVSHANYRCLSIKDVKIGGGQYVLIKLRHR